MVAPTRRIRPVGSRALMIDLNGLDEVLAVAAGLRGAQLPGVLDVIPAATTVMVSCVRSSALRAVREFVEALPAVLEHHREAGRLVTIEVVYDGAELAGVAELTGLSTGGVVAAHTGQLWTAAFGGFAPGFAYLVGENSVLDVPRLQTPRTRVPAGSVAVAGGFSAVYPLDSPGGWQLLGNAAERMWDPARERPALISPGDTVRFQAVREHALLRTAVGQEEAAENGSASLRVITPGFQATIQDDGRPGNAGLGLTPSGAMDRASLRHANALVGNPGGAAAVEVLFGGLQLEAEADVVLAVTGAPLDLTLDAGGERYPAPHGTPFALQPGERLLFGQPEQGLRSYLALRGGVQAPAVLGSRSTDVLSGTGPEPLAAGAGITAGPEPADAVPYPFPSAPRPSGDYPSTAAVTELRFVPGPRDDWFSGAALEAFARTVWEVSSLSNRVGLRLQGGSVERERAGELPSEGTVRGSLQVPASGEPVLFMADHPVTGGYPVIGTVIDADLDLAGQLPPGARLRFVPLCADEALAVEESVEEETAEETAGAELAAAVPGALPAPAPPTSAPPTNAAQATALIVGRGLDAVLAVRRLREEGCRVAVVYTQPDIEACHVRLADDAYRVDSYLLAPEAPATAEIMRRAGAHRVEFCPPGPRLHYRMEELPDGSVRLRLRVRAEDPARGFLPVGGRVRSIRLPGGPWIHVEAAVRAGDWVPVEDPLLFEVSVTARDRQQAVRRGRRALAEARVEGVPSTLAYLGGLLALLEETAAPGTAAPAAPQRLERTPGPVVERCSLLVTVNGSPVEVTLPFPL